MRLQKDFNFRPKIEIKYSIFKTDKNANHIFTLLCDEYNIFWILFLCAMTTESFAIDFLEYNTPLIFIRNQYKISF